MSIESHPESQNIQKTSSFFSRRDYQRLSAFTLIELLIVVTIISIIGISSLSGFSRMQKTQDMETLAKSISQTIESLDQDVSYSRITSYDAIFHTDSFGFTTLIDWYKKHIPVVYSFDFTKGTGSIQTLGSGSGIIQFHLHYHDSIGDTMQLPDGNRTQTFSFPKNIQKRWYQIVALMNDSDFLTYNIQYYNLLNSLGNPDDEASLKQIIGADGTLYSDLIVRNVLGQKTLFGSGSTLQALTKATLVFEKNGQEAELVIEP